VSKIRPPEGGTATEGKRIGSVKRRKRDKNFYSPSPWGLLSRSGNVPGNGDTSRAADISKKMKPRRDVATASCTTNAKNSKWPREEETLVG